MLVGNNVNGAFSEADMMRAHAADNIGKGRHPADADEREYAYQYVSAGEYQDLRRMDTAREGSSPSTAVNAVAAP